MSVEIKEIIEEKDKEKFIDFPHDLYNNDANYVPELFIAQKELFSPKKNPFFENAKVSLFLAYKEAKIVGRIAAIKNISYNKYHNCNIGFFGFFDCINDHEVAKVLFDIVKEWHLKEGHDSINGPTNFSTNDTAGLLVEGFDSPPVVMMTYNKKYYAELIEANSYTKEMDLLAYRIPTKTVSQKSLRISDLLEERLARKQITIREINVKDWDNEVAKIRKIYNSAWEKNWGFFPFSKAEFDHLAEGLKLILNAEFAYIAEKDGEAIGFMLALPNLNETLIKIKKGRLFPFGIFKLLLGRKKFRIVRVVTLGVVEEFRKAGIEGIFYAKIIKAAQKYNIDFGEASWILENNEIMNQGVSKLNGEKYKTYRIYGQSLK